MKKKIGFYGGTFDPIHFGHLNLAVELMETHRLDEVWFCPARINPHKNGQQPLSFEERLQMVRLAVEDNPKFKVIDIEGREGLSYTIDTLQLLVDDRQYQLFLLLGEDSVEGFPRWHRAEEIVQLVPLLIGSRTGIAPPLLQQGSGALYAAIQRGMTKTKLFDINATDIRARLRAGLYCGHLIPRKAIDFIQHYRLYS
jgi:nicotinate-nucleotide adenylyltransferase